MEGWWKRRSGDAKTAAVLAMLLVLQVGLCAVFPFNEEFGRSVVQGIIFLVTLASLIGVLVVWLLKALFR